MANKRLSGGSSLIKTGLTKTAAKNARKTFSSTTEKRETYPKPGVTARTAAKNAAQAARKPATTVTARPTTGITGGGNRTVAKNRSFTAPPTTEKRSSYASAGKSSTARAKKLY